VADSSRKHATRSPNLKRASGSQRKGTIPQERWDYRLNKVCIAAVTLKERKITMFIRKSQGHGGIVIVSTRESIHICDRHADRPAARKEKQQTLQVDKVDIEREMNDLENKAGALIAAACRARAEMELKTEAHQWLSCV
jgi:hypothetical protein